MLFSYIPSLDFELASRTETIFHGTDQKAQVIKSHIKTIIPPMVKINVIIPNTHHVLWLQDWKWHKDTQWNSWRCFTCTYICHFLIPSLDFELAGRTETIFHGTDQKAPANHRFKQ